MARRDEADRETRASSTHRGIAGVEEREIPCGGSDPRSQPRCPRRKRKKRLVETWPSRRRGRRKGKNDSWNGVDTYITGLTRNGPRRVSIVPRVDPPGLCHLARAPGNLSEPGRRRRRRRRRRTKPDEEEVFSRGFPRTLELIDRLSILISVRLPGPRVTRVITRKVDN